ncbi:MAG: hypothetical protein NXI31_01665 [bacterium]|nr:hypothetical protein [bacterium]
MNSLLKLTLLLGLGLATTACRSARGDAGAPNVPVGQTVYLNVGMHFQPHRGAYVADTSNLIELPIYKAPGSQFEIVGQNRKVVTLRDADGTDYQIRFSRHAMMPMGDWMARQFSDAPVELPADLTELEQEAIATGKCVVGMSRAAMILAVGYPPKSSNPAPGAKVLIYGGTKWARRQVMFDENDQVKSYTRG